ncbi:acyl-CoA dehydrogenase [Rhodococcus ruber BKS 20-38]|uniref:Acyl-CoA dehydrogenase n=1 Tax=Rhodococcus ruber BKS 20-38 TaxID=1278076 RepID=M2WV30_9NOCA|nr:acyl-CoA dehydrogenase family protein [Rhodococcus ruber]EME52601.1 acyl-CoA dehydrogenase [Rhodococcus ruber BKS 20-38]
MAGDRDVDELWSTLLDSGYPQIGVPERFGGVGDAIDLTVLLEEAGRALLPVPLLPTVAASQLLLLAGLGDDRLGLRRSTLGVAEGRVRDARVTCGPVRVLHGADAESVVLIVTEDTNLHVVEVDLPSSGLVTSDSVNDLDPSRPMTKLTVTDAATRRHREFPTADRHQLLGPARLCIAADLVGVSAGALDRTVQHILDRRQFGRQLAAFQAVKHQMADAYVRVEKARSLVLGTALAVRDEPLRPRTGQLSLFALGSSIEAAVEVSARCVQLLGAMGVTFEADAHLYLRRSHQTALALESASAAFRTAAEIERQSHV